MNGDLEVSALGLVLALLGVVLVLVLLRATAWLLAAIPMRQVRRSALRRAGPVVVGLAAVAYSLVAVRFVFRGTTLVSSLAGVAVVGVVLGLSWFALRDLVAGMFWKAGNACQPGDVIRIEGASGRVTRLGFRVLGIETEQGDRVFVPYSKLQNQALVVSREQFGESRHVFEVKIPTDRPAGEVERAVARMAMLCHGTSLSRRPRVRQVASDRLEVTVFALWSEPVADLEFRIRRTLEPDQAG
jgi:small-conductance mechanosensitive channel